MMYQIPKAELLSFSEDVIMTSSAVSIDPTVPGSGTEIDTPSTPSDSTTGTGGGSTDEDYPLPPDLFS